MTKVLKPLSMAVSTISWVIAAFDTSMRVSTPGMSSFTGNDDSVVEECGAVGVLLFSVKHPLKANNPKIIMIANNNLFKTLLLENDMAENRRSGINNISEEFSFWMRIVEISAL